jgi:two-component system, response regulator PdtaR
MKPRIGFNEAPTELSDHPSPVLVVEDEELLRLAITCLLEDAGFDVVPAGDAAQAIEILNRRSDIRVLFTDVQMPGPVDGVELARQVNQRWPHVLLLITSGAARPGEADIADHGHFLAKPYTPDQVVKEIDDLAREADSRSRRAH